VLDVDPAKILAGKACTERIARAHLATGKPWLQPLGIPAQGRERHEISAGGWSQRRQKPASRSPCSHRCRGLAKTGQRRRVLVVVCLHQRPRHRPFWSSKLHGRWRARPKPQARPLKLGVAHPPAIRAQNRRPVPRIAADTAALDRSRSSAPCRSSHLQTRFFQPYQPRAPEKGVIACQPAIRSRRSKTHVGFCYAAERVSWRVGCPLVVRHEASVPRTRQAVDRQVSSAGADDRRPLRGSLRSREEQLVGWVEPFAKPISCARGDGWVSLRSTILRPDGDQLLLCGPLSRGATCVPGRERGTANSPRERSDMRDHRKQGNPGCRFAHPGFAC
jgi:hypothetical protein